MQFPAMELQRRHAEEPDAVGLIVTANDRIRQDPRVDAVGLEQIRHFLLGFLEAKGIAHLLGLISLVRVQGNQLADLVVKPLLADFKG